MTVTRFQYRRKYCSLMITLMILLRNDVQVFVGDVARAGTFSAFQRPDDRIDHVSCGKDVWVWSIGRSNLGRKTSVMLVEFWGREVHWTSDSAKIFNFFWAGGHHNSCVCNFLLQSDFMISQAFLGTYPASAMTSLTRQSSTLERSILMLCWRQSILSSGSRKQCEQFRFLFKLWLKLFDFEFLFGGGLYFFRDIAVSTFSVVGSFRIWILESTKRKERRRKFWFVCPQFKVICRLT